MAIVSHTTLIANPQRPPHGKLDNMPRLMQSIHFAVLLPLVFVMQVIGIETTTVFRNGTDGYPVFRIPAIVRAANGDLLAFCEARQAGDASEIDLVLKRSSDGGLTWSRLKVVQESDEFRDRLGPNPPPITVGNPAPVVDQLDPQYAGRIWLPFTLENDRVFVTYSDDHGNSWSPAKEITDRVKRPTWGWYATGPVHSIQIQQGVHRGRLVVPCDHRLGVAGQDRGVNGAHVVYSDDHGQTWQLGAVDDSYQDPLNANETSVVELNDGQLYFNTRDQNGSAPGTRGFSYSPDAGQSFAPPPDDEQFKFFAPTDVYLDPPVVQCALQRVSSQRNGDPTNLILFSGPDENGPTGKGRSDLRIRYSTDETRSWHDGVLLHVGPAAYSDMVVIPTRPRRVGVLFEAGPPEAERYDRILFSTLGIEELQVTERPNGK